MQRVEKLVLTLLLALGAAFGAFAQEGVQPADPAAAPETTDQAQELPDVAWVRLGHFSPNASQLTVEFTPSDEETSFNADAFGAIDYKSLTEYMEVPAGNYTITSQGTDGEAVEQEVSFARGNYYTLAALGMVLPPEAQAEQQDGEQAEGEEGGFVGFFRNLFGDGNGDRDRYALQFTLFQDDLTRTPEEGQSLVRVVHAAPGTDAIDLAIRGEQGAIVNNVEFGDASRFASFEGSMEDLELRLGGSQAAKLELTGLNFQAGNLNTVYVVGTPAEEAPIETLGSSLAPVQAGMPAGQDVAAQGMDTEETAGGGEATEGEDAATEEGAEEPATEETEEPVTEEAEEPATEGETEEPAGEGEADGTTEGEPATEETEGTNEQ